MLTEKCGVFGVYGIKKNVEASRIVHTGLWALQHRGQESSGIASGDGKRVYVHKGMGLVAHVYNEKNFLKLPGHIAVGHNRYSTSGKSCLDHSQPVCGEDRLLAFGHNGNLPTTDALVNFLTRHGVGTRYSNDSELMYKAVAYYMVKKMSLEKAVAKAYPLFTGVFSGVFMSATAMVAVRDTSGIRPLSIGKINNVGYVVSSETCGIDIVAGKHIGDVKPGEMVVFDKSGMRRQKIAEGKLKIDAFEFVYFARPDSVIEGVNVDMARQRMGRILASENPQIKADLVIPIPDSGIPAAIGFSQASGIAFDMGLIKNRYIHRTFIRPAQSLRQSDVKLKLNPIRQIIEGKRVVLVDDSIVRGTTSAQIVDMVRVAGAKEVHFLVSSPPVCFPDFYGINTPKQEELVAFGKNRQEIRRLIHADSLTYLSLEGMIGAIGLSMNKLCLSCFNGEYPVDIGREKEKIKYF